MGKCNFCNEEYESLIDIPFKMNADSTEIILKSCPACLTTKVPMMSSENEEEKDSKYKPYKWTEEELEEYEQDVAERKEEGVSTVKKMAGREVDPGGPCKHFERSYRKDGIYCNEAPKGCGKKLSGLIVKK